ncbi:hypothetical protein AAEU28_10220 [Pseudoalteromonas sp. SS15]|uniref:hypothetical protein n=1 Tax=Pseudoalteromonas sp. SS15 TaxID=3139393 RepID=UPI003BA86D7D
MKLSGFFKASLITSALVLAGCGGGDINVTPTTNDNRVDNSTSNVTNNTGSDNSGNNGGGTTTPPTTAIECASYTMDGVEFKGKPDDANKNCVYSQAFASNAKDITASFLIPALPDGGAHIFEGELFIGADVDTSKGGVIDVNGPTLTIEAGVNIAFTKPESFIRIARGANIEAIGEIDKPIVFTSISDIDGDDSTTAQIGDWGGIQINGMGQSIRCAKADAEAGQCNHKAEGIVSYYGGNDAADDSGTLKHVVIKYAGYEVTPDNELNGLTLNAVGSGTEIEYIHVHNGADDGIELFGGSVDIKHIVITESVDDGIDWDEGWKGNGQFILVHSKEHGNHGFETDGAKKAPSADSELVTSVSFPTIANATVVTNGKVDAEARKNTGAGMEMKEWGKAKLVNMLFVNSSTQSGAGCFDLFNDKDQSHEAGVHANAKAGDISFSNSIFACGLNFEEINTELTGDLAGFDIEQWFLAGEMNKLIGFADFSNVLAEDGVTTKGTITDKDGNAVAIESAKLNADNSFFDDVAFIGAIGEGASDEWVEFVKASMARKN